MNTPQKSWLNCTTWATFYALFTDSVYRYQQCEFFFVIAHVNWICRLSGISASGKPLRGQKSSKTHTLLSGHASFVIPSSQFNWIGIKSFVVADIEWQHSRSSNHTLKRRFMILFIASGPASEWQVTETPRRREMTSTKNYWLKTTLPQRQLRRTRYADGPRARIINIINYRLHWYTRCRVEKKMSISSVFCMLAALPRRIIIK